MNIKVLDPAVSEFHEAIEYYNAQEGESGNKFAKCVETALARIIVKPEWNIKIEKDVYRI